MLQKCFPEIMALLLYKINDVLDDTPEREGIRQSDMHNNLEATLAPIDVKDFMVDKLPEVLIELFRNLHDLNFEIPPNKILPSPAPCRSDEQRLLDELQFLQVDIFTMLCI